MAQLPVQLIFSLKRKSRLPSEGGFFACTHFRKAGHFEQRCLQKKEATENPGAKAAESATLFGLDLIKNAEKKNQTSKFHFQQSALWKRASC
ncbi:hypothetical protein [Allobaculum fili]|uniref:hypothetical protein n=1 Tax=Allobaculum fili TaxID=2834460 RepID=UPI001E2CD14A|nr:hypothetical protein [Allobaculum fili]